MRIANPIYDSVFKYLLDDNEAAKILISNILDFKIDALQLEPTETILIGETRDYTVFRIDFKATITLENNEKKVVLIEIQKAKLDSDIIRFRKYLGTQYIDDKNTYEGKPHQAIPIYTIYFLGHTLVHSQNSPIINVNREYIDNYSKQKLTEKEEFIECLTHNSVVVQIPLFKKFRRNRLEKLLSIFEASTNHEVEAEDIEDEEYRLITKRLLYANSDKKIRQEMDVEDEIIRELANKDRQILNLMQKEIEAIAKAAEAEVKARDAISEAKESEVKARDAQEKAKDAEAKAKDAIAEAKEKAKDAEKKLQDTIADANLTLKKMIQKLLNKGFSVEEIAIDLEKSVTEIRELL